MVRFFKRMTGLAVWLALILILVVVYKPNLFWKKEKESSVRKTIEPTWITTTKVIKRDTKRILNTTGSFKGLESLSILPKVEGRVQKIFHDVGDEVLPGEPLLLIDDTDNQLLVSEARKSLDLELSRLGLSALPTQGFDFRKLPAIAKAETLEKNTIAKQERFRRLGTASTLEERDQLDTEVKVARSNLDAAFLEAQSTLATVRLKQALLETSMQKLMDARVVTPKITAPGGKGFESYLGGINTLPLVIYSRGITEGEMAKLAPQEPLFRMVIDRVLKLQVSLPERDFSDVKVGQATTIHVEAWPEKTFMGTVSRISPVIDPATRTFQVEVGVANPNRELRPGFFAKAQIEIGEKRDALLVPEESIVQFAGITKVFLVKDHSANQVEVQINQRMPPSMKSLPGNWVEVTGNLHADDTIIISGHNNLSDMAPVQIRPSQENTK